MSAIMYLICESNCILVILHVRADNLSLKSLFRSQEKHFYDYRLFFFYTFCCCELNYFFSLNKLVQFLFQCETSD